MALIAGLGMHLGAVAFGAATANAQSMSPMRGSVNSFSDAFALRVHPTNPYDKRIDIEVRVYDQDFFEVPARVSPQTFSLAAGATRRVTVVVPFDGATERRVRVCTESVPYPDQPTQIRTQICGKFRGIRRS